MPTCENITAPSDNISGFLTCQQLEDNWREVKAMCVAIEQGPANTINIDSTGIPLASQVPGVVTIRSLVVGPGLIAQLNDEALSLFVDPDIGGGSGGDTVTFDGTATPAGEKTGTDVTIYSHDAGSGISITQGPGYLIYENTQPGMPNEIAGITDGQGIAWSAANARFEPVTLGGGGGDTVSFDAGGFEIGEKVGTAVTMYSLVEGSGIGISSNGDQLVLDNTAPGIPHAIGTVADGDLLQYVAAAQQFQPITQNQINHWRLRTSQSGVQILEYENRPVVVGPDDNLPAGYTGALFVDGKVTLNGVDYPTAAPAAGQILQAVDAATVDWVDPPSGGGTGTSLWSVNTIGDGNIYNTDQGDAVIGAQRYLNVWASSSRSKRLVVVDGGRASEAALWLKSTRSDNRLQIFLETDDNKLSALSMWDTGGSSSGEMFSITFPVADDRENNCLGIRNVGVTGTFMKIYPTHLRLPPVTDAQVPEDFEGNLYYNSDQRRFLGYYATDDNATPAWHRLGAIERGGTADRPSSPDNSIRFNSDTNTWEGWNGTSWVTFQTA